MCFGNNQQTQTQTYTPPKWLQTAAQGNLGFAQNLQNQGFTPYTGQFVAPFSGQQQQSFNAAGGLAGSILPQTGDIGSLVQNYATAGPQSVTPSTISSQMSPYLNQYVQYALAPQLEGLNQQFAAQNKSFDSAATGAGAFGDTSWGLGRGNLTNQQDLSRMGLIGNAYNSAFNTAIGAGAQDVANNLNAQTTNANLMETALGRQLTGANTLYGLGSGVTGTLNQYGSQQTAQNQANLNALYNQYLRQQQYPFQTTGLVNQTIGAAQAGAPTTTTISNPNNMGYGLLGAGLGAAGTGLGGYFSGQGSSALAAALAGLAEGGKANKGQPVIVGERGPEVLIPNSDSVVIPNEVMQAAREKRAAKLGRMSLAQQLGAQAA